MKPITSPLYCVSGDGERFARPFSLFFHATYMAITAAGSCGRGVTRPAWWVASATCLSVIAISSSTRCVPRWSRTRRTTAGRVIGVTLGADAVVTEHAEYTALGGSLAAR